MISPRKKASTRKQLGPDADFDELVRDAERRAERLIAGLRIVIAGTLAFVFNVFVINVAPTDNTFVSTQVSLAGATIQSYAVLGVVSLILTAERWHRPWFSYGFVTADVAFVMASLYLSLRNIGLDGAYTVALPTIWIVPLILSFNALRFTWRVQAYAGTLVIVGLAVLSFHQGVGREGFVPEVLYTSFAGPPNIMRFAMIAIACAVLVFAVLRTRRLLRIGIEQGRRRAMLSHYLPPQVAELVQERDRDELRAGSEGVVVVMFVDIRGFTARAETMSPEAVGGFLAGFRRVLREAVDDAGGVIDKFIGDGAMVIFVARQDQQATARAALACAHAILAGIADWSKGLEQAGEPPVDIGIGAHIGHAFVGAVGDDVRLEFTVVGDVVNTAARLEEASKTVLSALVVSGALLDTARQKTRAWKSLPDKSVRGRQASVRAFAYTG
ncbi:MAG: adenylate/guanylate cyclase domain-containing protein [Pseudomonadota bacterium]